MTLHEMMVCGVLTFTTKANGEIKTKADCLVFRLDFAFPFGGFS